MIKGTGQRLIPRKLLEWIKGLNKGEGAGLNISTLTDSKGNPRFIEGDGVGLEKEGLTISYNKWSLSGSHLMLVIAGEIENGISLSNSDVLSYFTLPDFIKDKIYGVWGNMIEIKTISIYSGDWSAQALQFQFSKNPLGLAVKTSNLTTTAKRFFRIQFDLLIDTE